MTYAGAKIVNLAVQDQHLGENNQVYANSECGVPAAFHDPAAETALFPALGFHMGAERGRVSRVCSPMNAHGEMVVYLAPITEMQQCDCRPTGAHLPQQVRQKQRHHCDCCTQPDPAMRELARHCEQQEARAPVRTQRRAWSVCLRGLTQPR